MLRRLSIPGSQQATVTPRTQILARVEAEASDMPHAACAPALVFGADSLSCVLDQNQSMLLGEGNQWIHIGASAEQVNHDDGSYPRHFLQYLRNSFRVEVEGHRIHIRHQRQEQSICARSAAYGEGNTAIIGNFAFECCYFLTQNEFL